MSACWKGHHTKKVGERVGTYVYDFAKIQEDMRRILCPADDVETCRTHVTLPLPLQDPLTKKEWWLGGDDVVRNQRGKGWLQGVGQEGVEGVSDGGTGWESYGGNRRVGGTNLSAIL